MPWMSVYLKLLYNIMEPVASGIKPESLTESCIKYAYCKVGECNLKEFLKRPLLQPLEHFEAI